MLAFAIDMLRIHSLTPVCCIPEEVVGRVYVREGRKRNIGRYLKQKQRQEEEIKAHTYNLDLN